MDAAISSLGKILMSTPAVDLLPYDGQPARYPSLPLPAPPLPPDKQTIATKTMNHVLAGPCPHKLDLSIPANVGLFYWAYTLFFSHQLPSDGTYIRHPGLPVVSATGISACQLFGLGPSKPLGNPTPENNHPFFAIYPGVQHSPSPSSQPSSPQRSHPLRSIFNFVPAQYEVEQAFGFTQPMFPFRRTPQRAVFQSCEPAGWLRVGSRRTGRSCGLSLHRR